MPRSFVLELLGGLTMVFRQATMVGLTAREDLCSFLPLKTRKSNPYSRL